MQNTIKIIVLLIIFLHLGDKQLFGQIDTVSQKEAKRPAHSPKKAALFSAILPGAGQAYNKKWWKIPIVYAAIGTSTGFVIYNNRKFKTFKTAYIDRLENPFEDNEYSAYSTDQLFDIQDTYHNWRDVSIVVTSAFYLMNILDATIDAHFFRYDVGDDLTLEFKPHLNFVNPGMSICLRF